MSIATARWTRIGTCVELHDEAHGLFGEFRVHDAVLGERILNIVRTGLLPGLSIGFYDMRPPEDDH